MRINKINILTIAGLLASLISAGAQNPNDKLTREMTLERMYDPTVQDAGKVNRLPEIKDPVVTKSPINYSPFTVPANPENEINILPSGKAMTEIPYNNRKGYFHFGGGTRMNLSSDAGYHILNDAKNQLNLFASHRSASGNIKFEPYWGDEKRKAKFNDNLAGLNYRHYFDQGTMLRLGTKYNYTAFNYYGYSHNRIPSVSSIWEPDHFDYKTNQVNQLINGYVGIRSKEDAKTGYLADFEYNRFIQKYGRSAGTDGIQENKITIQAGLSKRFGNRYDQSAGFTVKIDNFNYNDSSETERRNDAAAYQSYTEATLSPYYRIQGDRWQALLGANIMFVTGDSSKLFASPHIRFEIETGAKTLFYVNASGEIQSNDPYSISLRNRYTNHAAPVLPSRTWMDALLGIRSGIVPGFWFDIFAGYKITANEVFFMPSIPVQTDRFGSYQYAFQPDASLFRIGANLKYACQQWVDFSLKAVYNSWSLKKGDSGIAWNRMKPYGRPSVEINADLTVRPLKPLALNFEYYLGANRYSYLLIDRREIKLDHLNDLNFRATWNFNEMIGAYMQFNNVFSRRQELYYGYPMQLFNAMVGVNINF
jgi:hypothetical protein